MSHLVSTKDQKILFIRDLLICYTNTPHDTDCDMLGGRLVREDPVPIPQPFAQIRATFPAPDARLPASGLRFSRSAHRGASGMRAVP